MTSPPETVAADRTLLLTGIALALLVVGLALLVVGRPYLAVLGSIANLAGVLILLDVWVRKRLLRRWAGRTGREGRGLLAGTGAAGAAQRVGSTGDTVVGPRTAVSVAISRIATCRRNHEKLAKSRAAPARGRLLLPGRVL